MIYVVEYRGLYGYREETWFPTREEAETFRSAYALPEQTTLVERKGLTFVKNYSRLRELRERGAMSKLWV